jgi:methylthioribose-1-phosphate isomerase
LLFNIFSIIKEIEQMLEEDINVNKRMAKYGAEDLISIGEYIVGNSQVTSLQLLCTRHL